MFLTRDDPRGAWSAGRADGIPSGAREVPLDWVCTLTVESRAYFDKDEMGEAFRDFTTVTGWREQPDPRVHQAGALSFYGVDAVEEGVLRNIPGTDWLGTSISVLTLQGRQLGPGMLERLAAARPWADLSIWDASGWSPASRTEYMRALASFTSLRGLSLAQASLSADDLIALSAAVDRLEDLALRNCRLDGWGLQAVVERLGELIYLNLSDAQQGPELIGALAPRLERARWLELSRNPIGDLGLRALLDAGALEHVEDLSLCDCELTDASARALAGARLPKLRGLWLDSNLLTDDGIEALACSPLLAQLEGLSLYQRGLTERSRTALAGHPLAGALTGTCWLPGVNAYWFMGR